MHVAIDQTRQNQMIAVRCRLGGGRWRALTDRGDNFATQRDIALAQDGIRGDDASGDDAVEWR